MMFGGGGGWRRHGRLDEEDDVNSNIYDKEVVKSLLYMFRPYWKSAALSLIVMLLYSGTVIAIPWLVGRTIDDHVNNPQDSNLTNMVLLIIIVATFQFFTNQMQIRVMAKVSQNVLYSLRVNLFSHLQKLPMSFFNRNQVGRVMSRIQNDVQQLQEFLSIMLITLGDLVSLIGIMAVMLTMNWKLALVTFSVLPSIVILLIFWQKKARGAFNQTRRTIAGVNAGLEENISGMRVVQSLNRGNANVKKFRQINSANLDANLKAGQLTSALFPSVEMISSVSLALVILVGGLIALSNPGQITAGYLVAFSLYIYRLFEPVRNLAMQYGSLQRAMVSGRRIMEILAEKPEVLESSNPIKLTSFSKNIEYQKVGFGYLKNEMVLEDIDLNIQKGQKVAFVGETGAGKTTLVSLLVRLYDPNKGKIKLDGHDLREISFESISSCISMVPQEPFLFSETVNENIRYNRSGINQDKIIAAAKLVGADQFIKELPDGYQTKIAENGRNLSVGQRQLISFARALVSDPKILILDEATANIDTESEMLIQDAIDKLLFERTSLVIAHRLSTVRNSDWIYVMGKGGIIEQGTHEKLLDLKGKYSEMIAYSERNASGVISYNKVQ